MNKSITQKAFSSQRDQRSAEVSRRQLGRWVQLITTLLLVVAACLLTTQPSYAGDTGCRVALTPYTDPDTGSFNVRIAGYRLLTAHVVGTPSGNNLSGVTVSFFTDRGTLSTAQAATDSTGSIGTTLWGGWDPGTATVRATVTFAGQPFGDVALVPVVAPNGETSTAIGFGYASPGYIPSPTAGAWKGNLTASNSTGIKFDGLQVTERSGGIVGSGDTCWYSGNPWGYGKFQGVSGGTWDVGVGNSWEYDQVGWGSSMVANYRTVTTNIPCGTHFTQYMDVVRPAGGNLYYTSNIVGAGIQATTVTSERGGSTQSRTWP